MSRYNNVSRSRSKERHLSDYYKGDKYREEFDNKRKELDSERILDDLKEKQRIREKQLQNERQNFLKRENDLLREINRLRKENYEYNQETPERYNFQRYQNPKFYRPYSPKKFRFQPPDRNTYDNSYKLYNNPINKYQTFSIDNQRKELENKRDNFENQEEKKFKTASELGKIVSNLNEQNIKEGQKVRNKIYLPNIQGVNLVGLLLGPKGIFLKLLEKQSGCKIYINGKSIGKRERYINPNDNDQNNVLIIAESEEKLKRGTKLVQDIIYADEDTRNKIISEQLKASKKEAFEDLNFAFNKDELNNDDYLMTKYGPPSKESRFYKVPDDCINSIIGKNGEGIKKISIESKCKVEIAKAPIPNTKLRYIFIEGTEENYEIARELIEQIIGEYVNKSLYLNK